MSETCWFNAIFFGHRVTQLMMSCKVMYRRIEVKSCLKKRQLVCTALYKYNTGRRRRPNKTWHKHFKDDMMGVGVTKDVALDRKDWRRTMPTPKR